MNFVVGHIASEEDYNGYLVTYFGLLLKSVSLMLNPSQNLKVKRYIFSMRVGWQY